MLDALSPHLKDLNPDQHEAVVYGDGPLLIFAGAGSGKTRVLTRRIAHLIIERGVLPDQILSVTFTNKAAKEMKERVCSLFHGNASRLWVSTFHSSCVRILRRHAEKLDYRNDFIIYDSSDSLSALKRVYAKLKLDQNVIEPRTVASRIDKAKNDYLSPEDLRKDRYTPAPVAEMIADLYTAYQLELHASNAMDFGDLISNVVSLFKFNRELLELYQEQFRYLLVDEYQDTNRVQYLLVKMLSEKYRNITVVGDDDQSIYAFRGATIENILNFKRDFPDAHIVTLGENYRSSGNILHAASAVISKNRNRQAKNIRTSNPKGELITCFKAYDEREEAEFIIQEILALIRAGLSLSEIAVFYRTNAQSRAIEEALVQVGMPYEIFGGHRFYDRKEIKDILAYYRLLLNPNDNEAFMRIINNPARGIGAASVDKIAALASATRTSLLPALRVALAEDNKALGTAKKKLGPFVEMIDQLLLELLAARKKLDSLKEGSFSKENSEAISHLLLQIANRSLYIKSLKEQDSAEAESRIENIYELFAVASDFVRSSLEGGQVPSLNDFLDRASLSSDLDRETDENKNPRFKGSIRMMTLHLAKGLEFNAVFMVGLEEGILPHARSVFQPAEVEEERRLCYVGITRARKYLFLTRASMRTTFGKGSWHGGLPSRFISELPRSILEDRRGSFTDD